MKNLFPSDVTQRLVLLLVSMLMMAIGWANWAQVPQLARSTGQVIAQARTQVIQAANDGVVTSISVHEGDAVEKGQLLMSLDDSQLAAAVADSRAKVAALRSALARLRAEVFQKPLVFPNVNRDVYAAFIANQTDLYRRRKQALEEELRTLRNMLDIAQEELDVNLPLVKARDVAETEIIRLRRAVAELEGAITNRRNKFFQDAQTEMTKTEEELATQEQVLAERLSNLERMQIFSPSDGLVRNVRMTTLGGRVRPGDVVMDLLPTQSALIVEAKLRPQDLAFIAVGQPATIKLDAYDYSIYGTLDGTVIYISPDALTEDTRAGEHVYYRVHLRLETPARQTGGTSRRALEASPGMTAQVEIRTGRMSVLTYLTKPLVKTLSSAFAER